MKKSAILLITGILLMSCCWSCNKKTSQATTSKNLNSLESMAQSINQIFVQNRQALDQLRQPTEEFYRNIDSITVTPATSRYTTFDNAVYYNKKDDGGCSVYATGAVLITEKEKIKIQKLEQLEPLLKETKRASKYASLCYLTTFDSIALLYPFTDMVPFVEPKLDLTKAWVTYWQADLAHNPAKKSVWVEPFIDAAGFGYITSVITPVYNKDFLEATLGIDIPIKNIADESFNDPRRKLFLVTDGMLLVAINKPCGQILKLKGLEKFDYLDKASFNLPVSSEYRLLQNESLPIRELAQRLQTQANFSCSLDGKNYQVCRAEIPEVKWYLVELK